MPATVAVTVMRVWLAICALFALAVGCPVGGAVAGTPAAWTYDGTSLVFVTGSGSGDPAIGGPARHQAPTTAVRQLSIPPDRFAGESGAASAIAGRNLGRQLASEQQMSEVGTALAGAGTATKLRAAERLAHQYGGAADDWAKMGSSSYRGSDGLRFETHWYQNRLTGQRFEFKTKLTP